MQNTFKRYKLGVIAALVAVATLLAGPQSTALASGFHSYQLLLKADKAMDRVGSMQYDLTVTVNDEFDVAEYGLYAEGEYDLVQELMSLNAHVQMDGEQIPGTPSFNMIANEEDAYFKIDGMSAEYGFGLGMLENQWIHINEEMIEDFYGLELQDLSSEFETMEQTETLFDDVTIQDLVLNDAILFDALDFGPAIDDKQTYVIGYTVDLVALVEYLEPQLIDLVGDAAMVEEMQNEIHMADDVVEIGGELFIDVYDFLPRRFTLNVNEVGTENGLMLEMNFSNFNEQTSLELPTESITLVEALEEMENMYAPMIEVDSDYDGLSDTNEMLEGTDMFNADTDGDGYVDGLEVDNGYSPLIPATR